MVNIVGLTVLQALRKFEGFENAIIAGGFVRDDILGGTFTDIDIYIPLRRGDSLHTIVSKILLKYNEDKEVFYNPRDMLYYYDESFKIESRVSDEESLKIQFKKLLGVSKAFTSNPNKKFGDFSGLKFNKPENNTLYKNISSYRGHYDCKYMDSIDVDIIGIPVEVFKDFEGKEVIEDFGVKVVETFNYNIDKCYFDGVDIVTTKDFEKDARDNTATLCQLSNINMLPNAMKKFFKLEEKYNNFMWRTNILSLISDKKEEKKKQVLEKADTIGSATNTMGINNNWILLDAPFNDRF